MTPVGRRLPKDVISFIKSQESSYRATQNEVEKRWNLRIPKSTISCYRRRRYRIKAIDLTTVAKEEWDWFQGLFSTEGSKTLNQGRYGKHYIIRISLNRKDDMTIAEKCKFILKAIGPTPMVVAHGNCM